MRILHIVTAFPRGPDDAITPWLVELLHRLQRAGHDVEVLTSAYRGSAGHQFAGIPVHRFRYFFRRWENLTHEETAPDRMRRSLLHRVLPLPFVAAGMLAAWRLARRGHYDVLHVHWPVPLALLGWAAQRARPAPIVTTFYGVEIRWVKHKLKFLKPFVAWAARRSQAVTAISSYTAAELRELVEVPIEVIPYAAPLSSRLMADVPRQDGVILFVGRLVERKGVVHLIDALARLHENPGARLVIVGDGPERSHLENHARRLGVHDRVVFRGRVSDAELRQAYAEASVFALPSVLDSRGDTEGLGVVLLEALQSGVPVVASRIGGIVDIVQDQETGLLVPPGDPAALARALGILLRDRVRARQLADAGRRWLAERFSWDVIVARWDRLYRALAPQR